MILVPFFFKLYTAKLSDMDSPSFVETQNQVFYVFLLLEKYEELWNGKHTTLFSSKLFLIHVLVLYVTLLIYRLPPDPTGIKIEMNSLTQNILLILILRYRKTKAIKSEKK